MTGESQWEAVRWAEQQTCGGPGPKAVLMAVAHFAGWDGECWSCYPGQARLAAITEQSERTVRRQLAALESAGLFTRSHRYDATGARTSDRFVLAVLPDNVAASTPTTTGQTDVTTGQPEPPLQDTAVADELPVEPPVVEPPEVRAFDEFWARYPRKVAKPAARTKWRTAAKRAPVAAILDGLDRWVAYWSMARTDEVFVPHPATWLHHERWNDKPPMSPRAAAPTGVDAALAVLAEVSQDHRRQA